MKKILLSAFVASATLATNAAATLPNYMQLDLSSLVSSGLNNGNNGLADFNGDGNLDIYVCGRDIPNGWKTGAYYLTGDGYSFDAVHEFTNVYDYDSQIIPLDYDIDGDIDVIYTGYGGAILLQNDGSGSFTQVDGFAIEYEMWLDGDYSGKYYDGIYNIADFNHDGYPDILCFANNTPTVLINNSGDGTFVAKADTGIQPQRGGTMAVGDINSDGYQDIIASGWSDDFGNHCIRVYLGNGDGSFSTDYALTDPFDLLNRGTEKGHIILVDIDSDGDLDLFVTGESCPQNWARLADLYINDGKGVFSQNTNVTFSGVGESGADWCDLNHDGTIDLIYSGYDGQNKTYIVLNEGDGTFTTHSETAINIHRGGAVFTAADFNSNGWVDILAQGYSDGNDTNNFQIVNCLGNTKMMNQAPTAPTALAMTAANGKVTFTWEAGSDSKTPTAALRYNVYVKLNDGKLITVVPADPATGKLRNVDVNAALTTCSYSLNIDADDIAEWGVQTIDGAKLGSEFAKGEVSAIESIEIDSNETTEYYNLQGIKVANPENGLYIIKQGKKTSKVFVK